LDPTAFIDLAFMLVATVLTILSVHTLQLLAKLRLSKSFFIPVLVSAVFFWYGSLSNVVFNLCLQYMPNLAYIQEPINFLHQITMLIGLSILTTGVFSYWKHTRQVKVPKHESSTRAKEPQEDTQKTQQPEQPKQKTDQNQTSQPPSENEPAIPEVVIASAIAVEEEPLQTTLAVFSPKPEQKENESE
jgi:hypothetical protein